MGGQVLSKTGHRRYIPITQTTVHKVISTMIIVACISCVNPQKHDARTDENAIAKGLRVGQRPGYPALLRLEQNRCRNYCRLREIRTKNQTDSFQLSNSECPSGAGRRARHRVPPFSDYSERPLLLCLAPRGERPTLVFERRVRDNIFRNSERPRVLRCIANFPFEMLRCHTRFSLMGATERWEQIRKQIEDLNH